MNSFSLFKFLNAKCFRFLTYLKNNLLIFYINYINNINFFKYFDYFKFFENHFKIFD